MRAEEAQAQESRGKTIDLFEKQTGKYVINAAGAPNVKNTAKKNKKQKKERKKGNKKKRNLLRDDPKVPNAQNASPPSGKDIHRNFSPTIPRAERKPLNAPRGLSNDSCHHAARQGVLAERPRALLQNKFPSRHGIARIPEIGRPICCCSAPESTQSGPVRKRKRTRATAKPAIAQLQATYGPENPLLPPVNCNLRSQSPQPPHSGGPPRFVAGCFHPGLSFDSLR